jgi:RND family efflux transporter MFP subunit
MAARVDSESKNKDADLPRGPVQDSSGDGVSTGFAPDTAARLKRAAVIGGTVLGIAFVAVTASRYLKARSVASQTQEVSAAAPLVDVIEAQPVSTVQSFLLPGQTAAWHASTIYARVNGYVGQWLVDIGDKVHQGQLLALIETPEMDAQLAQASAQLEAARAQVLVRRAEAELSKSTYERWRDSPKGVVSDQEREEKHADYDSAVARLRAAQADVVLDQARVNQYTVLAQFKQVTAPYDGVITEREIDIGNLVTAGSTSATTPLYAMTQNDPMRIFVDVPQSAAAELMQAGVPVNIQMSDGSHHEYSGQVTRTAQALNREARTLRVEVDIPNKDQQLVPGMYVKVGFALKPKGLVQIPAAALLLRAGGPQVARVDPSGRVNFRNVTIARDDGSIIELASGVAPGDLLVLNASSQIVEGQRVAIQRAESGASASPRTATANR